MVLRAYNEHYQDMQEVFESLLAAKFMCSNQMHLLILISFLV